MIDRGFVFLIIFTVGFFVFSQSPFGNTKGAQQINKYPPPRQHLALKQNNKKSDNIQTSECLKNIDLKNEMVPCREPTSAENWTQ
jgi:hypothetical protein